jgi:hypothetical protein
MLLKTNWWAFLPYTRILARWRIHSYSALDKCARANPVPVSLDKKKGQRRGHLLLNKRLQLLPHLLSNEPGTAPRQPVLVFLKNSLIAN